MSSRHFILFALVLAHTVASGQSLYFPPTSGSEWETISPESVGWCTDKIPELRDFLEANNTKSFIVLKDGKIVIEEYFNNHNVDMAWYWASAGKTLTAFAVGQALTEGLLDLEDKTSTYLGNGWTSLDKAEEDKIKIIHQLTMTSGLDERAGDPYCTEPSCLEYKADPGDRWAYHNAPYTLLDKVIEGASGTNLNGFIQNRLLNPTGMTGLFLPSGYNNVFWSTARSMARFGLLVSNDGVWDEDVILDNASYIDDMRNTSQDLNPAYGYLWWLNGKDTYLVPGLQIPFRGSLTPSAPDDMYSGLGKDGQFLNIVPSEGLVVIRMGEAPDNSLVPIIFLDDMWDLLSDIICLSTSTEKPEQPSGDIYPNPSDDVLYLPVESGTDLVTIISGNGHSMQVQLSGKKLDIGFLPAGAYILILKDANGYLYQYKFVKSI